MMPRATIFLAGTELRIALTTVVAWWGDVLIDYGSGSASLWGRGISSIRIRSNPDGYLSVGQLLKVWAGLPVRSRLLIQKAWQIHPSVFFELTLN